MYEVQGVKCRNVDAEKLKGGGIFVISLLISVINE